MFYNNFIKACNIKGKTPSAALTEAGIDKSAATRWKSGKNPTDATIQKLADYFGMSPSDLKGETTLKIFNGEVIKDSSGGELSTEALAVAKAYDIADDRTKQIVKLNLAPFGLFEDDQ